MACPEVVVYKKGRRTASDTTYTFQAADTSEADRCIAPTHPPNAFLYTFKYHLANFERTLRQFQNIC